MLEFLNKKESLNNLKQKRETRNQVTVRDKTSTRIVIVRHFLAIYFVVFKQKIKTLKDTNKRKKVKILNLDGHRCIFKQL